MNTKLFYTCVVLCVAAHIIRSLYEVLKHTGRVKPSKISFWIIFFNMGVLWISWFSFCSLDVYTIGVSDIVRAAGIAVVGTGVIVFLTALFTIKTLESYEGDLMTKGIYSKIRHPMYLGFVFWLIGSPLFYGSVFSFFLSMPFILNILFWRHLEEMELAARFPLYNKYKQATFF